MGFHVYLNIYICTSHAQSCVCRYALIYVFFLCMYIIHIYDWATECMRIYVYVCLYVYMYIQVVCVIVCMCIYVFIGYTCSCIHACMHACHRMCVILCVCMYVCYTHVCKDSSSRGILNMRHPVYVPRLSAPPPVYSTFSDHHVT